MFCTNCGSKLPDGVKFCSECGARLVEVSEPERQPISPSEPVYSERKPVEAPTYRQVEQVDDMSYDNPVSATQTSEASARPRMAFDWSNVIEEPHRKVVSEVQSPWSTSDRNTEKELFDEVRPATDRSRTMNFIDLIMAEKEAKDIPPFEAPAPKPARFETPEPAPSSPVYEAPSIRASFEQPKPERDPLADLYGGFDQPISTRYDEPIKPAEPTVASTPSASSTVDTRYDNYLDLDEDYRPKRGRRSGVYSDYYDRSVSEDWTNNLDERVNTYYDGGEQGVSATSVETAPEAPVAEPAVQTAPEAPVARTPVAPVEPAPVAIPSAPAVQVAPEDPAPVAPAAPIEIQPQEPEEYNYVNEDEDEIIDYSVEPSKSASMTIAAPADKESEIEELKRKLAELTGVPFEPAAAVPAPAVQAAPVEPVTPAAPAEPRVTPAPTPVTQSEPVPEMQVAPIEPVAPVAPAEPSVTPAPTPVTQLEPAQEPVSNIENILSSILEDDDEPFELEAPAEPEPVMQDIPAAPVEPAVAPVQPAPAAPVAQSYSELAPTMEAQPVAEDYTELAKNQIAEPVTPVAMPEEILEPVIAAPAAPIEMTEDSDALSIEELEKSLFGEEVQEAETTKKIDKFYTLYRKNEDFQRLLDEEYNKLKTGNPAPEQILPDPEPVRPVEDATIYQPLDKPLDELAREEAARQAALVGAPAAEASRATMSQTIPDLADIPVTPVPSLDEDKPEKSKLFGKKDKKAKAEEEFDEPDVDYEEVDKRGTAITIIAVIVALLLVVMLAVILVIYFAPDSGAAMWINSIIENITSHFSDAGYDIDLRNYLA